MVLKPRGGNGSSNIIIVSETEKSMVYSYNNGVNEGLFAKNNSNSGYVECGPQIVAHKSEDGSISFSVDKSKACKLRDDHSERVPTSINV